MENGNVLTSGTFPHIEVVLNTLVTNSTTVAWQFMTYRTMTLDITTSGLIRKDVDGTVENQCICL